MTRSLRLVALTALAVTLNAGLASAAPILVATFSWDLLTDPCLPEDPACATQDPFTQSVFSLTSLWDEPLSNNQLILPDETLKFDDLGPFEFTQIGGIIAVPGSASTNVSFVFEGQTITVGGTLSDPGVALLQFDPTTVPEPGTLGLLAIGSGLLGLRSRKRRQR